MEEKKVVLITGGAMGQGRAMPTNMLKTDLMLF